MNIGFDVDGTLCTSAGVDLDDVVDILTNCVPHRRVLEHVRSVTRAGHTLSIITARGPHVHEATLQQLEAWLPGLLLREHVLHRPRLLFDWRHYVSDKETQLRQLKVDVYVGDRAEDKAAALRAGARFVWAHRFEQHGLPVLGRVTEDWVVAPCGCRFRREQLAGTMDMAFVIKPCRIDCKTYVFAQQETLRQRKALRFVAEASWNQGDKRP